MYQPGFVTELFLGFMVVAVGDTVDVPLGSLTVVVGPPSDQPVSHHANLSIHNQHSSVGRSLGPTVPWFGSVGGKVVFL